MIGKNDKTPTMTRVHKSHKTWAVLMILWLALATVTQPIHAAVEIEAVHGENYRDTAGPAVPIVPPTMRLIGQMISLGIAMLTFSVIMGHVEIAPAQMDELMVSIKVAFGIFAGLCLMGMLFSLARGKMQREQTAM